VSPEAHGQPFHRAVCPRRHASTLSHTHIHRYITPWPPPSVVLTPPLAVRRPNIASYILLWMLKYKRDGGKAIEDQNPNETPLPPAP